MSRKVEHNHQFVYVSNVDLNAAIMTLCQDWARMRSKDPNTKVGSCVYHPASGGMYFGYNGFPKGIPDACSRWDNRDPASPDCKYNYVVHAETNAVAKARMAHLSLHDCILFTTNFPCHHCMKDSIVPAGIKEVVYLDSYPENAVSRSLARLAGVRLTQIKLIGDPRKAGDCVLVDDRTGAEDHRKAAP